MRIKSILVVMTLFAGIGGLAINANSEIVPADPDVVIAYPENVDDFVCCPDMTTASVDVSAFCTGTEIHTVDASVATCTEYEESFFTWTWTPIQGATITPTSGDQADFLVTGAVGTDVIFRVKAVSSDPSCTEPIKSYRFVIPITSQCGWE